MRVPKGFTMLELMVSISIVALLCAVSAPGFSRLQGRARQSEAKTNLRALWASEQGYFYAFGAYSASVSKIGFEPLAGNRYQYNLNGTSSQNADNRTGTTPTTTAGADAIMIDLFKFPTAYRDAPLAPMKCGLAPAVKTGTVDGSFVAGAQGNIDEDRPVDQWSIASFGRTTSGCDAPPHVPAGEPANDQNDINAIEPNPEREPPED
ncbi:MAG: prepilin-type N-terminal cleavage/methylation domain-containing protein [Deltaproteobacteria bacterium]|nr:MAG: prepilin-type N-terminal cleavage/methylation domain-containing protein [Deltaproteobacteria bacterium]